MSRESIQMKKEGPDSTVSNNQFSTVTINKKLITFSFILYDHCMYYLYCSMVLDVLCSYVSRDTLSMLSFVVVSLFIFYPVVNLFEMQF